MGERGMDTMDNDGREGEKENEELWIFEVSTNGAEGFFFPFPALYWISRNDLPPIEFFLDLMF